jgi:hypothetical protein
MNSRDYRISGSKWLEKMFFQKRNLKRTKKKKTWEMFRVLFSLFFS